MTFINALIRSPEKAAKNTTRLIVSLACGDFGIAIYATGTISADRESIHT